MLFDFSQATGGGAGPPNGLTQHSSIRYMPRWGGGGTGRPGGEEGEEKNASGILSGPLLLLLPLATTSECLSEHKKTAGELPRGWKSAEIVGTRRFSAVGQIECALALVDDGRERELS